MKHCSVCKADKPTLLFSKRAASKDGYSPKCKECAKAYGIAYYERNGEAIRAKTVAWSAAHPEERQQEKARYRSKHREAINAKFVRWYALNRDADRVRCARYHAANPHIALERGRKWAAANRDAANARICRRRARKAGADGRHDAHDVRRLQVAQRWKCAACKRSVAGGYHVDHIKPLAKGGSNWPNNLQLLCAHCNRRKSAKAPEDFMREMGYLI